MKLNLPLKEAANTLKKISNEVAKLNKTVLTATPKQATSSDEHNEAN